MRRIERCPTKTDQKHIFLALESKLNDIPEFCLLTISGTHTFASLIKLFTRIFPNVIRRNIELKRYKHPAKLWFGDFSNCKHISHSIFFSSSRMQIRQTDEGLASETVFLCI